ncbi:hypothetical protein [Epilithonimonas sp. UC225_85]|uniref:hypothetical protein n=1 Tax=Epilithonimonas sp. UC225_85 TaxID=3350167 RepID=UPI0036D2AF77
MKNIFFLLFLIFISCEKSVEEDCFKDKDEKIFNGYVEVKPYTVKEILKHKPEYLTISDLKKFRSFKEDSIANHTFNVLDDKKSKLKLANYNEEYQDFDKAFLGQFGYYFRQNVNGINYAFGKNGLGFWLLKIENNRAKAYFLGLSFSHYYINEIQTDPIIKNGELQLQGSLVQIIKVPGLPGYDDYSAIADGKLFKIKLSDLEKDSDNDGYNDIFEESFGLDPKNKDTDSDGVDDLKDMNPLFKSEKNKFTQLYEEFLINNYAFDKVNLKEMNYFISVYENDCEYFQKVNPQSRTLIVPEDKDKLPYYLQVTNVVNNGFSKLQKDSQNKEKFYFHEWGGGSTTDYSVEFIKGKWKIIMLGGTVS